MDKITKLGQLRTLSQELGIELPEVRKSTGVVSRKQSLELIKFAIENKFTITPVGYGYYVDSFNQFNACPCDDTRKSCPCEQAVEEINSKGHCLCHLFWRNLETYLEAKFK